MNNKLNSTQFIQLLEQDLLTLEERSKEYFFERLIELFQYKEVQNVVINNYSAFGVEILDSKNNLTFVASNNATTNGNHYHLTYHLVVHDNENNIHLLSDVIKRYEDIYKKIYAINSKYVTAYEKIQSQNSNAMNTPQLKIERNKIDNAKKMFFTPQHYQRHMAQKEKDHLEQQIVEPSHNRNHFKV
jgi:hypothetical protein